MNPLARLFDQFLKERTYLKNVTPSTLIWYRVAFKNYAATIADEAPPVPTKLTMQPFVITQRERGIRPVTVNTYLGAMNAFCAWLHQEGHVTDRVKLPKLRVERRLLSLPRKRGNPPCVFSSPARPDLSARPSSRSSVAPATRCLD